MNDSPVTAGGSGEPGIILIQIDGLAYVQLQRALEDGRLPFLQRLIETRNYRLKPFYSGLPSTTPAVQAELFFGVKGAVPAIRFLSRTTGDDNLMLNPIQVREVAEELAVDHRGLLNNGSSYSNIYIGGALSARYCIETLEPRNLINNMRPLQTLWIFLQHLGKVLRIIGLALVESGVALVDFWKGIRQKQQILKELKFVPTRIWVCVILREFIRFWVKRDILRGVPIICANFVGYDEHSHRRGPNSAFAHWSLIGIDGVLRDIYNRAQQSKRRKYRMLIYADHGQEAVVPYQTATGKSLSEGLQRAFATGPLAGCEVFWTEELLGQVYFFRHGRKLLGVMQKTGSGVRDREERIVVTALGPLGHIYLPERLEPAAMDSYARSLVDFAGIPLVIYRQSGDRVLAINRTGSWALPESAARVLGPGHPYIEEAGEDLVRLVDHADAGDFVISGWQPGGQSLSFPQENGAHGGPGSRECQGFLLLPEEMAGSDSRQWRPSVLREAVMDFFESVGSKHG